MKQTLCHLCLSNDFKVLFRGSSSDIVLSSIHLGARQGNINKEFSYNWVRCNKCKLTYANPAPDADFLSSLYVASDQGSYSDETDNLSYTYGKYLTSFSGAIVNRRMALDVGAGTGFFLKTLKEFGFSSVIGIEPSTIACDSAASDIRPHLKNATFSESDFSPGTFDLISCFQTLEHVPNPNQLLESFSRLLAKGGILYSVAHNVDSFGVKLLRSRHPIVNAGHLTLFDCRTLRMMVEKYFDIIDVFPIRNRYSIAYWLTLFPLPSNIRKILLGSCRKLFLDKYPVTMSLGNIGIMARKR